jgi:hypothetical protein
MPDIEKPAEAANKPVPPKRSPGHRGQDVRDTVAEMAAKAHEISLEAGSKMAAAMKDVVGAAAGMVTFSLESARDLIQFMVRRSQMTQEEADKLLAAAEAVWLKKHKGKVPAPRGIATAGKQPAVAKSAVTKPAPAVAKPASPTAAAKPAAKKPAPVAKNAPAAKKAPVAKKAPAAKKPTPKK